MVRVQITVNGRTRILSGSLREVAEALQAEAAKGVPFLAHAAPPVPRKRGRKRKGLETLVVGVS